MSINQQLTYLNKQVYINKLNIAYNLKKVIIILIPFTIFKQKKHILLKIIRKNFKNIKNKLRLKQENV